MKVWASLALGIFVSANAIAQPVDLTWGMSESEALGTEFLRDAELFDDEWRFGIEEIELEARLYVLAQTYGGSDAYPDHWGYTTVLAKVDWAIGEAFVGLHFFENQLFDVRGVWPRGDYNVLYRALVGRYGEEVGRNRPEWRDGPTAITVRGMAISYTQTELRDQFAEVVKERIRLQQESEERQKQQEAEEAQSEL